VAQVAVPVRPVLLPIKEKEEKTSETEITDKETAEDFSQRIGIVFNFSKENYPQVTIDAIIGEVNDAQNAFVNKIEKPDITRYINTDNLPEGDKELLAMLRKLQDVEINKYVSRNSPFSGIWENIIHHETEDLPAETKELMAEYLLPKLKKIFTTAAGSPFVFLLPNKKVLKTANLETLQLQDADATPFFVIKKNGAYQIQCRIKAGGIEYDLQDNESNSPFFFIYNQQAWLWKNVELIHLLEKFLPSGKLSIKADEWNNKLADFILPLAKTYKVDFDKSLVKELVDGNPEIKLFLVEKGEYLVFQPVFSYKGYETKAKDRDEMVVPMGEKVVIVRRNREKENEFIQKMQNLHSAFIYNEDSGSLALKGADVLKNNWFFFL
jgi:non-specific serine/threonine protein kinase